MSAPHVELLATFDSLSLALQREGFRPCPIIELVDLHVIQEHACDRCGVVGMEGNAFYQTVLGECRLGLCRIIARCPVCGASEEV